MSSLIIKIQDGSRWSPIIYCSNSDFNNPFIFQNQSRNVVNILEFDSIDLRNVNIFGDEYNDVTIIMNNCSISSYSSISFIRDQIQGTNHQHVDNEKLHFKNLQIHNSLINCNNQYEIHDCYQKMVIESIIIKESVLVGCNLFFNSSMNYSTPLKLVIEDTTFQGNVNKSVAFINRYANIQLQNVNFTNNNGRGENNETLFHVTVPFTERRRSTVTFQNVIFQNNSNVDYLLQTENTYVNGTLLDIKNNINNSGIFLINTTGVIDTISATDNIFLGYFVYTRTCNIYFGELNSVRNKAFSNLIMIYKSVGNIRTIVIKENIFPSKYHIKFTYPMLFEESHFKVTVSKVQNIECTVEVLALRGGRLTLSSFTAVNNTVRQILLQIWGTLHILSGNVENNNCSASTIIGSIHANKFDIQSMNIVGNLIGDKVFHVENVLHMNFQQIDIRNNDMNGAFHLIKGNVFIDGVNMENNTARKHGKALTFDDLKTTETNYNVTIKDFHAKFQGFTGIYESNIYFEIDINHSNLTVWNSSIDIDNVYVPTMKIIRLLFATKNPNVHPQIAVVCPTNYDTNPVSIVKLQNIDYSINCQRCPKDKYSLLKGHSQLKGKKNLIYNQYELLQIINEL